MMKRIGALLLPTALALSACTTTMEDSGKPHVVASFYALEYIAEAVGGNAIELTTLGAPGADSHSIELSPSQVASLTTADAVLYLEGFQPAVDEAIDQAPESARMQVGVHADLLAVDHEHDREEHDRDHDHDGEDHDHDHGDEDGHEGHDHGDHDPHFWLDPLRLADVADALADRLGEIEPTQADAFAANAADLRAELTAIDDAYADRLASCERDTFITSHEAFGYIAHEYGLTEVGISGLSPDDEPSPARIAEIHALAEEHGVTTIFFETLTSPAVAQAIAGDLGLDAAVLDPLEGVTAESPGEDYPSIMMANLEALERANDCG